VNFSDHPVSVVAYVKLESYLRLSAAIAEDVLVARLLAGPDNAPE
jgi:hypothetical protein